MCQTEVIKILEKQLRLLSEYCKSSASGQELAAITPEIVRVSGFLLFLQSSEPENVELNVKLDVEAIAKKVVEEINQQIRDGGSTAIVF